MHSFSLSLYGPQTRVGLLTYHLKQTEEKHCYKYSLGIELLLLRNLNLTLTRHCNWIPIIPSFTMTVETPFRILTDLGTVARVIFITFVLQDSSPELRQESMKLIGSHASLTISETGIRLASATVFINPCICRVWKAYRYR